MVLLYVDHSLCLSGISKKSQLDYIDTLYFLHYVFFIHSSYILIVGVAYVSHPSRTFKIVIGSNPKTMSFSITSTMVPKTLNSNNPLFDSKEEIIKTLNFIHYPWDDMHHHS
jgi:hypothetical protein